jgi:hypothetical protein
MRHECFRGESWRARMHVKSSNERDIYGYVGDVYTHFIKRNLQSAPVGGQARM